MRVSGKEQQVFLYLLELVKNNRYKPGDSFVSEQWVKKQLNVSLVTVRNAYDKLVENGIIVKSQGKIAVLASDYEKGLYRIRLGPEKKKLSISLIFPETSDFFPQIIEGIEAESLNSAFKFNFSMNSSQESETLALDQCFEERADGIIITPVRHFSIKNYIRLQKGDIPFVMIGKPPIPIVCNAVYANDVYSSYEATNVLFARGCVSVVQVTYTRLDTHTSFERFSGFEEALHEKGYTDARRFLFDFDREGEENRLMNFLRMHHHEKIGILLSDDLSAPLVYDMVEQCGKTIGDNLLVIGYNNTRICEKLRVPLTAVDLNWRMIGRQAIRILNNLINGDVYSCGKEYVNHLVVNHKIVFRQSCK